MIAKIGLSLRIQHTPHVGQTIEMDFVMLDAKDQNPAVAFAHNAKILAEGLGFRTLTSKGLTNDPATVSMGATPCERAWVILDDDGRLFDRVVFMEQPPDASLPTTCSTREVVVLQDARGFDAKRRKIEALRRLTSDQRSLLGLPEPEEVLKS